MANKANKDEVAGLVDIDAYTKKETDELLVNKVNTTPPEIYDLPVAEGLVTYNPSFYCKDALGRVHINLQIRSEPVENEISNNMIVANLPCGFRPDRAVPAAGAALVLGEPNKTIPVHIYANPDGTIYVSSLENLHYVTCELSLLATQ